MARRILSAPTASFLGLNIQNATRLDDGNYDFGEMPDNVTGGGQPIAPGSVAFGAGNNGAYGGGITNPLGGGRTTTPTPTGGTPNPLGGGRGTPSGTTPNPLGNGTIPTPTGAPSLGSTTQPNTFQPFPTTNTPGGITNPLATPAGGPPGGGNAPAQKGSPLAVPGQTAPVGKGGPGDAPPMPFAGGSFKPGGAGGNPLGRGAPNPAGGTPGQNTNASSAAVDERGMLMLPDGSRLETRNDPRQWGTTGAYVITSYDPRTGQYLGGGQAPRGNFWEGGSYEEGQPVYLKPEVLQRLRGRVQIPSAGVGGFSEVKDPSKVEWDPEFGFLTTPDNIGPLDDKNSQRVDLAMMIAMSAMGASAAAAASGGWGNIFNAGVGVETGTVATGGVPPPGGGVPPGGGIPPPGAGTIPSVGASTATHVGEQIIVNGTRLAGGTIPNMLAAGTAGVAANTLANNGTRPTSNTQTNTQTNTNTPTGETPPAPPPNTPSGFEQIWNGVRYVWNGLRWAATAMGLYNALSRDGSPGGGTPGRGNPTGGPGGTTPNLLSAGLGIWDSNRNRQQYENDYRQAADVADYNRDYRPGYLSRYNQFMMNPEQALNDPTFRAVRERGLGDLERRLNARGFNMSGNEMGELQRFGQEMDWKQINSERDQLRQASSLGDPSGAANILSRGASDSYRSRNNRSAGPGASLVNAGLQIAGRAISDWINGLSSGDIRWADIPSDIQHALRAEIPDDIIQDIPNIDLPPDWNLDPMPEITGGEGGDNDFWDWLLGGP